MKLKVFKVLFYLLFFAHLPHPQKALLKGKLKEKNLGVKNHYVLCEKCSAFTKTNKLLQKTRAKTLQFRKDGPGGGAGAAAGTKTCLDNSLISRRVTHARTHARTQHKHKHETRFPGWRCHKGLTPPTSDIAEKRILFVFSYFFLGVLIKAGISEYFDVDLRV